MKSLASVKTNGDFVDLSALSGYRLSIVDPEGKTYHLGSAATDEELGEAVVDVLNSSRSLDPAAASALRAGAQEHYEQWVAKIMSRHGYKTRRQMFEEMRSCRVERSNGEIVFIPLRHEKLEGWSGDGITPDDHVVVAADAASDRVGAALRLALERCP